MSILSQIAVTQAQALASSTLGRFDFFVDSLDDKLKAYDDTNTLIVVGGSNVASGIGYTLTVPSDWDGTPANVQDALDELASRVKGIEDKTDLITVTAAIDLDDVKAKADSALQSGDNVSELVNDAGYTTAQSLSDVLSVGDETGNNNIVLDPGSGPHTSPPSRGSISVTDPGFLTTSTIFFLEDSPNTRIDVSNGGTINQGAINIWGESQTSIRHTIGNNVTVSLGGISMVGTVTMPSSTGFQLQDGANEIIFTASPTSNGLTQTFQDASGTIALLSDITPSLSFNVDLDSSESSVSRVFAGGRTTFTITHNLGTLDLKPEVFRLSDGRTIGFRVERTGINTIEVSRNGNIADGLFRLVI